ncbi:MAG: U32 family peptidase [Deltaproteobacteria bacterium]|nr:U32 family peptidase [Syntrophaceae bacterium]NLX51776.1 U32 family peptidase [Deltaproteobacteria bacterium]
MTIPLELLSPAGDADIGMAAIDAGADAVYIGAPRFSARAAAGVNSADLDRLIRQAHFYRAKVYVALNTILTDAELAEALDIIREVYALGADGLILQDVGLLELDLPPIPLIASTQMHNSTPEKVKFLEDVGFRRVILARELSLRDIAAIRRHTKTVELEAFVHGALCVSYSGQCYMSQAVAGRSGNRGVCAQPCRSHYTLIDGRGRPIAQNSYLLSLRDMNRLAALPDLIATGVTSFKIEGRYKGISYVKNVTAAYRQAIDRFIGGHPEYRRAASGACAFDFMPDVHRTFNRGYTSFFLSGGQEKIASLHTPKSIGQSLGKISAVGKDFFQMARSDLQNGDGLCFFTRRNRLAGVRVERVEHGKIFPGSMKDLETGVVVYRNFDAAFERILKKATGNRRIGVELDFRQDPTGIRLTALDEDGNKAETAQERLREPARDPDRAAEAIKKHLTGAGNTPYRITKLSIAPRKPGFLSAAVLNGLRRDVLEKLTAARLAACPRQDLPFRPNDAPYPEKSPDFHANVMNAAARKFYERHGAKIAEPAFEILPDIVGRTVMTSRYCIRYQLDLCPRLQSPKTTVPEPLRLRDAHHTYRLEFDCQACRMRVALEK